MLKDAFEEINLPLYLVPYSVIPNRTGPDHAQGGILQVSTHQISPDYSRTHQLFFRLWRTLRVEINSEKTVPRH